MTAPTLLGKYALDIAPGMATFRGVATDVLSQVDVPAGATFQGAYPGGILLGVVGHLYVVDLAPGTRPTSHP